MAARSATDILSARAAALATRPLDPGTLIALAGALLLIAAAVSLGGAPGAFVDLPSILIVLGGTFAVTCVSYSTADVLRAQPAVLAALTVSMPDAGHAARGMVALADLAARHGAPALQARLAGLRREPYLHRALSLAIDAAAPEDIEAMMTAEAAATGERQARSAGILRRAAEVAPAMGLIGTLVGLVQMLGHLDDPTKIGPAMALALLTTFYGALLANIVLGPLAGKLDRNAAAEDLLRRIYLIGATAIARQDSPRRLETLLNTVLPPEQRLSQLG
jgi:chemotaxis protein MotA